MTDSPKKPARARRLTILVGTTVGILLLAELVVRVMSPDLRSFDEDLFGDRNSRTLFVKDEQLHWKLRPNTEVRFKNGLVRTNDRGFRVAPNWTPQDDSSAWRILCLGGSTMFGLGLNNNSTFAAGLAAVLNQQFAGERRFVTYNAGVPGYSSRQVLDVARRLIPELDPHAVIVCVGNNDKWPVAKTDAELAATRPARSFFDEIVDSSDLLTWISEFGEDGPVQSFMQQSLPAVPRIRDLELRTNLQGIFDLAESQDTFPILIAPPVNLEFPPVLQNLIGASRWRDLPVEINKLIAASEPKKALDLVEEKLAEDETNPFLLWHKGTLVSEHFDEEQGRVLLEAALQTHPFPSRTRSTDRRVMTSVARANPPASFLNPNSLFRKDRSRLEVRQLFLDQCNPTPAGHRMIGEWLAADITQHVEFIDKMKAPTPKPATPKPAAPIPSVPQPKKPPGK